MGFNSVKTDAREIAEEIEIEMSWPEVRKRRAKKNSLNMKEERKHRVQQKRSSNKKFFFLLLIQPWSLSKKGFPIWNIFPALWISVLQGPDEKHKGGKKARGMLPQIRAGHRRC